MEDEVGASNVNRAYSLAGTSIAIFTFMLFSSVSEIQSGESTPCRFKPRWW